jgi:tRNA(adenine34) deaminase
MQKIEKLVLEAMREAERGFLENKAPFWAILVDKNWNIVEKAFNTSKKEKNAILHAEINLIEKSCKKLKIRKLNWYKIITNLEPCVMCASAILKSWISEVYYWWRIEDNDINLTAEDIFNKSKNNIIFKNNILKEKTLEQYFNFKK